MDPLGVTVSRCVTEIAVLKAQVGLIIWLNGFILTGVLGQLAIRFFDGRKR